MGRFFPVTCALLMAGPWAFADKDLEKALNNALKTENGEAIKQALLPIVSRGGRDNAALLLDALEKMTRSSDDTYWQIVNAVTSFNDTAAMEELGEYMAKKKKTGLVRDLLFALQNNHSTAATAVHAKVLEKGADDMKPLSVDQLAAIEAPAAVDVLIAAYEKLKDGDPLAENIDRALRILTGADCGDAANWAAWWSNNRDDGLAKQERSYGSGGTVTADLDPSRAGEFAGLETISGDKIIVLKAECPSGACNYDSIERLLEQMGIPHTVVARKDFEADASCLNGAIALILNCVQIEDHCICKGCKPDMTSTTMRMGQCSGCNTHDIVNHRLSSKAVTTIKTFVENGGYLFGEDWSLTECLEVAWPQHVKSGKMLGEGETPAQPARGMTSHPFFRGVFVRSEHERISDGGESDGETVERGLLDTVLKTPEHFWTIDDESPAIKVVNPKAVTVLLRSQRLIEEAEGSEAVAITFQPRGPKGGTVLHVLSHFGKQESQVDEYAMQNLLLNFLLDAVKRL